MNHSFSPNIIDKAKCRVCKFDEISHTDRATCECCGNSGKCDVMYGNMLLCQNCIEKEKSLQEDNSKPEVIAARVDAASLIAKNQQIEQGLNISEDLFNAKMISIIEIKRTIDLDESIPLDKKIFELAKVMDTRYTHLREILPKQKQVVAENENEQRAIQTYYNELAKKLKAEEREQLKLKDVNYKPIEPAIKKQKAPSTKSLNKIQLHKFAADIANEFPSQKDLALVVLQSVMVSQNCQTVEAAYNIYKGMLKGKAS